MPFSARTSFPVLSTFPNPPHCVLLSQHLYLPRCTQEAELRTYSASPRWETKPIKHILDWGWVESICSGFICQLLSPTAGKGELEAPARSQRLAAITPQPNQGLPLHRGCSRSLPRSLQCPPSGRHQWALLPSLGEGALDVVGNMGPAGKSFLTLFSSPALGPQCLPLWSPPTLED